MDRFKLIDLTANRIDVITKPIVYKIINAVNDKIYIGQTIRPRNRLLRHKYDLLSGNSHSIKLQRAFNKHGEDVFFVEVLEIVDDYRLVSLREQYWIETLDSCNSDKGYNILIYHHTPGYGPASEEKKRKISESLMGHKHSEESKKKMSVSRIGRKRGGDSHHAKIVYQYTLDNHFIKEWEACTTAERTLNISKCSISQCARGSSNNAGGFLWKYEKTG